VEGERLARERGWPMVRDGEGQRRVVASPAPRRILELKVIQRLLRDRVIVVCAGGGGIPVVVGGDGSIRGVEAVVDKDHSAELLAEGVGADGLLLLTDTAGVRSAGVPQLRDRRFDPGSMGPKVEAACRFVERTGGWAAIGALEQAGAIVAGSAGTWIEPASRVPTPSPDRPIVAGQGSKDHSDDRP
jgi:carbamate kinase